MQASLITLPFTADCAEFVRIDHCLEHLPQRMAVTVLHEARRVLQPGGEIRVGVPDISEYFTRWPDATLAEKASLLRGLYGGQSHDGEYHQSGYDPVMLRDLLEAMGFEDVIVEVDDGEWRSEGFCIAATGRKSARR